MLMFILSAWRCQWFRISTMACFVEESFKPPKWSLPIWGPVISHRHSIDSMTFDKTGVSDIGHRSLFMSCCGFTLSRFITVALFQSTGKKPSRCELLSICLDHKDDICDFYNERMYPCLYAGECTPTTPAPKHKTVPGWNDYVEHLKQNALDGTHTGHGMTILTMVIYQRWGG